MNYMQGSNYSIKVAWQKIQNKSNIQYFCVLCNVSFRNFVVFTKLFRKSLNLPVQSNTLYP